MLNRVVLTLTALMVSGLAAGQTAAPGAVAGRSHPVNLVGQVERGCFVCHDVPRRVPNGPNREALWKMTPEKLYEAMTTGPKAAYISEQKELLTDDQKRGAAELITGKAFGGGEDRKASSMKNRCATPLRLDPSKPSWNGFSPDTENKRLQPAAAAGLTPEQVPNLKLKWAFAIPGSYSVGQTTPTVFGGAVFMASDNNIWEFNTARDFPETVNGVAGKGGTLGGPGGASVAGGMLFVSSGYGILGGMPGNVVLAFSAR